MGTIKKIINHVYGFSNNVEGIYDKSVNVFRKKLSDGTFERNIIKQANSGCFGTDPINMPNKVKVIVDWVPDADNSRSGMLFSLTDWTKARTLYIKGHYSNYLYVAMYDCNGNITNTAKYRIKMYETEPVRDTHNIITAVFDFDNEVIESVTNSAMTLPTPTSYSINQTPPFVNQPFKRTFEIGNWSVGADQADYRGFSRLSSVYVEDVHTGQCLLNLDFCGDTPAERLTDKSHLYQMQGYDFITWEKDNVSV